MATNLGLELALLGHQVHFISYESPFRLEKKHKNIFFHKVQINEYSLFKYPDYTLPLAVAIEEVQKRYGLDVVHVHYAVPHATAALLAKRIMRQNGIQPPKIITTLHGTDITLLAKDPALFEIIKYSVERSNGVTAVSQNLKNDTIKFLKTEKDIEVIYNFYSPPAPKKTHNAMRRELKIKDSDVLAIHLSNVRPVKRIPDLLKVAAKMKTQKNFKLLILSGGDFKPFKPLVKKLKLGKQLIVKENVKDIENYLNAADLGLYTSETESFGMGILETMSYENPIVSTNVGGVPEVMEEGKSGFLLALGDVSGMANKVKLLVNNENLRKQMGQHAKKIACEKFCSKVVVPQYLEYYKKIIEEK
ncbi:MAG: N-acetyl-alpha-D-glucosaminyl L-malate synthase BshA [Candidatus Doudnabacteria bacterium]|nr:N-acetyl-alpha-D-glucosaminyl L-malate synthase BshA [Candidatus Doudnabacteria bacterium]